MPCQFNQYITRTPQKLTCSVLFDNHPDLNLDILVIGCDMTWELKPRTFNCSKFFEKRTVLLMFMWNFI